MLSVISQFDGAMIEFGDGQAGITDDEQRWRIGPRARRSRSLMAIGGMNRNAAGDEAGGVERESASERDVVEVRAGA